MVKRMKQYAKILIGISLYLLLVSCSNPGDEFIGSWKNTKKDFVIVEIAQNGSSFIVYKTSPSILNGLIETQKISAQLQKDALNIKNGIVTFDMIVEKTTGNLIDPESEYKKITEDEKNKIKVQIEEYNKKQKANTKRLDPRTMKTVEPD